MGVPPKLCNSYEQPWGSKSAIAGSRFAHTMTETLDWDQDGDPYTSGIPTKILHFGDRNVKFL